MQKAEVVAPSAAGLAATCDALLGDGGLGVSVVKTWLKDGEARRKVMTGIRIRDISFQITVSHKYIPLLGQEYEQYSRTLSPSTLSPS